MDLILVTLAFYRVTGIDWVSSVGSDDVIAYVFNTGSIQGYPAEKIVPVKRPNVDDGPVVPIMTTAVDVNRILGVQRKTISEVERHQQLYRGIVDDDAGQSADVPADVMDDLDDFFEQKTLWRGDGRLAFTDDDSSFIITDFAWLSRTVTNSVANRTNLGKQLLNELEASQAPSAKTEKEAERQTLLVPEAQKSKKNALYDIVSLHEQTVVAGTREAKLLSSASAASR